MKSLRPWVNAILGLLMLVQGFAVAAGDQPPHKAQPDSAAAASTQMPCHGGPDKDAPAPCAKSCCDGGCSGMTSCAFGHLAVATALSIDWSVPAMEQPGSPLLVFVSTETQALLRPPIAIHA